jgi:hypothetical protein
MASYEEIYNLRQEVGFSNRIQSAIADVANDVRQEDSGTPNHANRLVWAANAMRWPAEHVDGVVSGVLIANKAASVNAILSADDADLKTAVAALVDLFAGV